MLDILYIVLLIFQYSNCIINQKRISENIDEYKLIDPGISKTYFIQYQKNTKFTFNISDNDILQVNIHAINCNIKLDIERNLLNKVNLNTYSILLNSKKKDITITPLVDIIDGQYKENYEAKCCPLSINSYLINDNEQKIKIENKEENIFYLNNSLNFIKYII